MIIRSVLLIFLVVLVVLVGVFLLADFTIPASPPALDRTMTPNIQRAPLEIGSFDIMGHVVSREEAAQLLQTEEGRQRLSREQGALEITEELIELGREAYYLETFGNEVFLTDVVGVLDGPINLWSVSRAILGLGGGHTTNLRVPIDDDLVVGGRTFPAGSYLDTGLDVPPGSLLPIGMRLRFNRGTIQVGVTCAMCHVTVDPDSEQLIEGATNPDIDTGLILAMASNSAAMFRHTDVNPLELPAGEMRYVNGRGELAFLPDRQALEAAVDEVFLSWPPATFDATMDLVANPTFIASSFTFGQWPYGWNGFGSLGWFQGLTTLNNNVHAVSADNSTDALFFAALNDDFDSETYMGILLQNASADRFRLPPDARPTVHFAGENPFSHTPGTIEVEMLPGYPRASSPFVPTGLVATKAGFPFAEHLNGMSAFQNTLAPPANEPTDQLEVLELGAHVFVQAGCAECLRGRFFSNNSVIPAEEIGTEPTRALGLQDMSKLLEDPVTYPPSLISPIPPDTAVIPVPTDTTPEEIRQLALAIDNEGGYKVVTLIGVYLQAPYLHDASVAAGPEALREQNGRYVIADPTQLGAAGTTMRGLRPDPAASLRVLVDRQLRGPMIEANQAHPDLVRVNVIGIGHEFWVDEEAGFTLEEQNALILFLLSLDDDPAVLPQFAATP